MSGTVGSHSYSEPILLLAEGARRPWLDTLKLGLSCLAGWSSRVSSGIAFADLCCIWNALEFSFLLRGSGCSPTEASAVSHSQNNCKKQGMIPVTRKKDISDKLVFHRDAEILRDQVENDGTKNKVLL